jgi:replicative DNA helicase
VSAVSEELNRAAPSDIDAEKAVLGAVFLKPETLALASEIIDEHDFYLERHQLIFRAMLDIDAGKKPIDAVTVASQLSGQIEQIGGAGYIAELADFVPTWRNVAAYARVVREKSVLRQLAMYGTKVASQAYQSINSEELVAVAEFEIAEIASKLIQKPEPSKATTLAEVLWKIERGYENSVPTGLAPLDQSFGGFNLGHLTMLAARTSKGKTALATQMAINAAKAGFQTAYFTLEQPADEMWARAMGYEAELDLFLTRRRGFKDGERERLEAARQDFELLPLEIRYRPSMRPRDLRLECKGLIRSHGALKFVIVDYFNLMRGDRHEKDRWREMQEVILALKALAGELGIPILLLSQLNRETNENEPPLLSNLRDTGASEEHASNVLLLWQPPSKGGEHISKVDWADVEIIIGKQRNGPDNLRVPMQFRKQWGKFR